MSTKPFANIQGLWGQAETGSRIFVSYRRDDARGDAGRLTDKLKFHSAISRYFAMSKPSKRESILSRRSTERSVNVLSCLRS